MKSSIGEIFFSVLFPRHCPFCGKLMEFNHMYCEECEPLLPWVPDSAICPRCGKIKCVCGEVPSFKQIFIPFFYTGIAAQAIQALKFQNKSAYARSFGHILAEIIAPKKDLLDCILAVPMTDTDIRKRGYSQSALIARFLGERLNVPVERGNLVKIHQTEKQHFLNQEERRVNLEGAFGVRHPERLKGKSVLICDDVLTTGSTLREVAKTLNQHEVLNLYAAVISTTDSLDNL